MCKAMEEMRNETATLTKLEDVKNIMKKLSYTAEQAMDLLSVSDSRLFKAAIDEKI